MDEKNGFDYRTIFHETVDAVIITNGSSAKIVDVNKACSDMLGYSKAELAGRHIHELFDGENVAPLLQSPQKVKMFGSVLPDKKVKTKSGELLPIDMTINTFTGDSAFYVMTTLRDIRERIKYEQEILSINKELAEANAAKDKLFSIIGHDLRNPMVSLMGISEILATDKNEISEEQASEFINMLSDLSKSTYDLLNNLLSWAQVQTKKIEIDKSEFDLFKLVEKIISLLKPIADIKKVNLVNDVNTGITVYADQNMINTIIRNLISNSIKFSKENSNITVSTLEEDNGWQIVVKDEGVGMEESYAENLFKVDVHTSRHGTNNEKGTGLGLILCYEFAKLNGGDIKVESEVGKGSQFTIQLPKQTK